MLIVLAELAGALIANTLDNVLSNSSAGPNASTWTVITPEFEGEENVASTRLDTGVWIIEDDAEVT
jgi:hypothetical protein